MTDRITALTALLAQTMEAHGHFEETELHGVYDQEWARWYAAYAVEHGIGTLIGHPVAADRLADFLASTNVEYESSGRKQIDPWPAYTARRIAAEL
jgi:hypothetical protein